tara:strand:+ start:104 stop:976 length:873 start_codon:yes stop_codon:yes gene_type:complete
LDILEQFIKTDDLTHRHISEIKACYRSLDDIAPDHYRQVAAYLVWHWGIHDIRCAGIGGGQGAGKSTLAKLLEEAGQFYGKRVVALSIDDFYYTKSQRHVLGSEIHSLLETRGPPGTHDVEALIASVENLLLSGDVSVPVFDKGLDDRTGERLIRGRVQHVVVEGWCIGATAVPSVVLKQPINNLELTRDQKGIWRTHVNEALSSRYSRLNSQIEQQIFLKVPSMDAVKRWRLDQERERPFGQRMTKDQVSYFVDHYERVTLEMLRVLPHTADIIIDLDPEHRIANISRN